MPIWIWFPLGVVTGFALGQLVGDWRSARPQSGRLKRASYNPPPPADEPRPKAPPAPPLGRRLVIDEYGNLHWVVGRRQED